MNFLVKKLKPTATIPSRGSEFAAGYDLYACEDYCIAGGDRILVSTGISIALPFGTYGRIASRSGLAVKQGIEVGAGVIDYDYRGEVKVLLHNHKPTIEGCSFHVKKGNRIAQLIIEKCFTPGITEVDDLNETVRGSGGFGSTGFSKQDDPLTFTVSPNMKRETSSRPYGRLRTSRKCWCDEIHCDVCIRYDQAENFGLTKIKYE